MRLTTLLILRGWVPLDDTMTMWVYGNMTPQEPVSFWDACATMGVAVPHLWDPETCSCKHCGMTQFRVFIKNETMRCMGVPDAQSFQDSSDHDKLTRRIKAALNGEEGMIWDSNE